MARCDLWSASLLVGAMALAGCAQDTGVDRPVPVHQPAPAAPFDAWCCDHNPVGILNGTLEPWQPTDGSNRVLVLVANTSEEALDTWRMELSLFNDEETEVATSIARHPYRDPPLEPGEVVAINLGFTLGPGEGTFVRTLGVTSSTGSMASTTVPRLNASEIQVAWDWSNRGSADDRLEGVITWNNAAHHARDVTVEVTVLDDIGRALGVAATDILGPAAGEGEGHVVLTMRDDVRPATYFWRAWEN